MEVLDRIIDQFHYFHNENTATHKSILQYEDQRIDKFEMQIDIWKSQQFTYFLKMVHPLHLKGNCLLISSNFS